MKIYSIKEAANACGITMQAICERIKKDQLETIVIDRKTFIEERALKKFDEHKWMRRINGKPLFDKKNLSVRDLAKKWSITENQIYYLIRTKRLPYKRVRSSIVFDCDAIKKIKLHVQRKISSVKIKVYENQSLIEKKSA